MFEQLSETELMSSSVKTLGFAAHQYISENPTSASFRGYLRFIGRTKNWWRQKRVEEPDITQIENVIYECIASDVFRRSNILLELLKEIEDLESEEGELITFELGLICPECGKKWKELPETASDTTKSKKLTESA